MQQKVYDNDGIENDRKEIIYRGRKVRVEFTVQLTHAPTHLSVQDKTIYLVQGGMGGKGFARQTCVGETYWITGDTYKAFGKRWKIGGTPTRRNGREKICFCVVLVPTGFLKSQSDERLL
jgi:hypothetical protein